MATVLVVDDHLPDRHLLGTLLKHAQHRVLEAVDGAQALQLARAEHPDLVISDVLLPRMDGYELVRQLRADPALAQTTVIFYTAMFGEHEAKALARDIGVARVLVKPTDPEKFLAIVAEVLAAKVAGETSPPPAHFDHKHQELLLDKLLWQIEALHQSEEREQIRAAELQAVLDAVPAYIFLAQDPDCHYMTGNAMMYELLRLPPGSNVSKSAPEDQRPRHFRAMKDGQEIAPEELPVQRAARGQIVRNFDVDLVFDDGAVHCLLGNAVPLLGKSGSPVGAVGAFIDVTAHRQLEAALKQAHGVLEGLVEERTADLKRAMEEKSRLALIVESSDDAIISKTLEGVITSWNPGAKKIYGYAAEEVIGQPVCLLKPPECPDEMQEILAKIKRGEPVDHFETIRRCKDGERIHVSLTISPIRDAAGELVGAATIARDITERKRAEEALEESRQKLRVLTAQLISAQETERKRLSLELHDGIGQGLTYMKLTIRRVMNSLLPEMREQRQECKHLIDYINGLIDDIRRLSRRLGPYMLDDFGLVVALEYLINEFERLHDAKVVLNLDCDLNQVFSPDAQTGIYRIFQEAFNNIAKHAGATEVAVVIRRNGDQVYFLVEDKGIGFDLSGNLLQVNPDRGMGLSAMEERVRMLGGNFQIWSQPSQGTKLSFSIPATRSVVAD